MDRIKRQGWLAWGFLGLLAISALALAVLQYRWIGEVSIAERERLREALDRDLIRLSRDFNREISAAVAALMMSPFEDGEEAEDNFAARYRQWHESAAHPKLVKRVGMVHLEGDQLGFALMDSQSGEMKPADWPADWATRRESFAQRMVGDGGWNGGPADPLVIEIPRFSRRGGPGGPPAQRPREWMIVEFDGETIQRQVLPELMKQHLGANAYDAAVVMGPRTVFDPVMGTAGRAVKNADGQTRLFDIDLGEVFRRRGGGRFGRGGPGSGPPMFSGGGPPGGPGPVGTPFARGRWELRVRHQGGSLDAIVAQTRWRNLAVSGAIFVLMLATAGALVRVSRRSQQLAELQMNFVAGVSHELRTPLTVIRTAGHNLQGRLSSRPEQVERYGKLIQDESEKLTALVEQVLRFASARAGHVIREKEPAQVGELIEAGLRSSRAALEKGRLDIQRNIEPGLPAVLADSLALKHVFQNLLDNAIKYGTETSNWIGLEAAHRDGQVVITVADRGPGIPADEMRHVFDPFFRGKRAIQDQVHGTGLGLNLVKEIVAAHGGTIEVESEPGQGTRFIVRLPAAPPEYQDEFAHTTG